MVLYKRAGNVKFLNFINHLLNKFIETIIIFMSKLKAQNFKKIFLYNYSYMRLTNSLLNSLILDKQDKEIHQAELNIPKLLNAWKK